MMPIPWNYVESWSCITCGGCCRGYDVVLDFPEWVNIVKEYGVGATSPGISRLYLKRKNDGTCLFLCKLYDRWLCALQHTKPTACKLWPFKISERPRYGRPIEALYNYRGRRLFIYVDPSCVGIRWGKPTTDFTNTTLTEFVELALGIKKKQYYSTSLAPHRPVYAERLDAMGPHF